MDQITASGLQIFPRLRVIQAYCRGCQKFICHFSTVSRQKFCLFLRIFQIQKAQDQRKFFFPILPHPYIFPFIFQKYSQTHLDVAGFITVDQFRTEMIVLQHFQNLILMFCSESFHRDTQFNCCTSVCRYKLVVF